ncbi:MAG: hypothetical protein ACRCWG_05190 [Sarcina sp.]
MYKSFILTMRNVNKPFTEEIGFKEACFILTMRNVNYYDKSKAMLGSSVLS